MRNFNARDEVILPFSETIFDYGRNINIYKIIYEFII